MRCGLCTIVRSSRRGFIASYELGLQLIQIIIDRGGRAINRPSHSQQVTSTMTKPIPDKAEVALEYPDKLYIGTFERTSRFDAHLDETGISLSLHRTGAADVRKSVRMHFHYGLFADILHDLAKTVSSVPPADAAHRDALREAAKALYQALNPRRNDKDDIAQMTPEEEVLLLHVME
jgi:hypothetical protein